MGFRAHKRACFDVFRGKYRMLSIFLATCAVFLFSQQVLNRFQAPLIPKPDKIPAKIWQSWKVDALHFEERDLDRARTWARKNPSHRYELLTDYSAIPYVEEKFGCGPLGICRMDIIKTYNDLNDNLKIIQADLLRYMIMYVDGGLWADIDVEDIQPIRSFIPRKFDERDIDMVIGIETDEPGLSSHPVLGSKAQSFCQWTFSCKPGLPVMMRLIENILAWLHRLAEEQGKAVSELHLDFDEVLSGTGPSAFTKAILIEMSIAEGESITWDDFHDLADSQLVGGVLVLPSEAFAAGTGHSRSGNHKGSRALVKHHFHASSWTSKHQRFKHPVYDEIEKCNWDADCVALWDSNVAFYDSLPEEEQLRMIELKRIDEAKEKEVAKAKAAAVQVPIKEAPKKEDDKSAEGKTPPAAQGTDDKAKIDGLLKVDTPKEPPLKDLKAIKDNPDNIKIQKENTEKKVMPEKPAETSTTAASSTTSQTTAAAVQTTSSRTTTSVAVAETTSSQTTASPTTTTSSSSSTTSSSSSSTTSSSSSSTTSTTSSTSTTSTSSSTSTTSTSTTSSTSATTAASTTTTETPKPQATPVDIDDLYGDDDEDALDEDDISLDDEDTITKRSASSS